MKKRVLCLILLCACVVGLFGCSGKNSVITVKDGYGFSYFVTRDENGFINIDDKGRMKVVGEVTTQSGESTKKADENSTVDFPYFVYDSKRAECYEFYIDIPEGWTLSGTQTIKLTHTDTKTDISFTLRTKQSVESCVTQIKDLYKEWNPMWDEKDIDLTFAKAKYLASSSLFPNTVNRFYVFTVKETTYLVKTTNFGKLDENISFEEIIKSVKFR